MCILNEFVTKIESVNNAINGFVWGIPALILLLGTGVLMTVLLKGFQFTHFCLSMKETLGKLFTSKSTRQAKEKHSISQFQALCTALSATIGTGNISGIALAITMGGPGAIFWMWVAAIVGMMTNYAENVLGIYYRRRNNNGEWSGGAMYYLSTGLGGKKNCKTIGKVLAVLFSLFTTLAAFGIGNMGQVVSIKDSVLNVVSFTGNTTTDSFIIGIALMLFAALVIIGGIKRIAKANERIVPFMACFYIIFSLILICMNADMILPAFASIFENAFNPHAVAGGVSGAVLMNAITWGFKRGVFSNEAGLGSSVMVHSVSNVKEPVTQGMWGIFEVFFDTIIVCTLTALVILTSGTVDLQTGASLSGANNLGLATEAFTLHFGTLGGVFIAVAVTLFAFSTVLGWSYYGTKAWEYLFGTKSTMIFKVIFVVAILAGTVLSTDMAISLSDTFNGLMAIPNLVGVIALSGVVVKITRNYLKRNGQNGDSTIKPMLSYFPEIQEEQEKALEEEKE